jgi:hypothetical protein
LTVVARTDPTHGSGGDEGDRPASRAGCGSRLRWLPFGIGAHNPVERHRAIGEPHLMMSPKQQGSWLRPPRGGMARRRHSRIEERNV